MRIDPSAASKPRLAARVLAGTMALAVLAAAAGCGSSSDSAATTVDRLAAPGSTWADLSTDQQRAAIGVCRLDAAAAVADLPTGGTAPAVARNGAFTATLELPTRRLRRQLDEHFADGAHGRETVAAGCRAVLSKAIDGKALARGPAIDFGPPMRSSSAGLRLTVRGGTATVPFRVTPAGARVKIGPAPGRAKTTASIAVHASGDHGSLRLTGVPRGTSYLRATVGTASGTTSRLIVLHGTVPTRLPEPRTFPPMRIHGTGSRGLIQFYLPQDGRATVTTEGAPLTLTSAGTVLLAHSTGDTAHAATIIPAGRYRDVAVRTSGAWSIRIDPAR